MCICCYDYQFFNICCICKIKFNSLSDDGFVTSRNIRVYFHLFLVSMDASFAKKKTLLKRQNGSKTLPKAYPYGMNDKFGDKTATDKCEIVNFKFKPPT